jgi:hypothetical protein
VDRNSRYLQCTKLAIAVVQAQTFECESNDFVQVNGHGEKRSIYYIFIEEILYKNIKIFVWCSLNI